MRRELERIPIPGAEGAEERAWAVVARAYGEHEWRPPRRRRGRIALVAVVVAAVLAAVAVSPAGSDLVRSVRKAVGVEKAAPALTRLPAPGRLLVTSASGPWIVQANGSKRLLGPYVEASWSPHGLFVAVTKRHELLAVDPHGTVRWSLARRGPVTLPRWAPDGYRIAYLDGSELRIVNGDGTGDRAFAPARHVAGAWRPSAAHEHVLAFVTAARKLRLADVDRATLATRPLPPGPRQLLWSTDGQRLAVVSKNAVSIFDHGARPLGTIHVHRPTSAAFAPHGHVLAVLTGGLRSYALGFDVDRPSDPGHELFGGPGTIDSLAWSPDGRWVLLGWRTADQWLFVGALGHPIRAVSAIRSQFDPAAARPRFPVLDGWCC